MKQPLVTIIGRPNVGKSTLFNRILRRREAIVHNIPGVTRDRHFAQTDWNGKSFLLVDTGGYLPQSTDMMETAIREQVDIAIEEADLILFLVEQSTGISDIDQQIAQKLHRTERPVLLVVNKVDHAGLESEGYQFYSLGLGEPVLISAAQGRGIGDMLDILSRKFENLPDATHEKADVIKLAVIGKENVGKSFFVNTLLGEERVIVTPIPGTTRDPIDTLLKFNKRHYLLIDTAGLKRRSKVVENILFYSQLRTLRSIQRADVVLYFLDANEGVTRQDLRAVIDAIELKKSAILVVNKWDLIEKDDKTYREWELDIQNRLGTYKFIPIIFTSVLQKKRLYKLLEYATIIYEEQQKKVQTKDLNRVLLPIIEQNTPPAVRGKEIKINYITQLKISPPLFAFFCNHPALIPTNYRRFLEKQIRNFWGFNGIPVNIVFKSKRKKSR
jgi:GTP-binding protein